VRWNSNREDSTKDADKVSDKVELPGQALIGGGEGGVQMHRLAWLDADGVAVLSA